MLIVYKGTDSGHISLGRKQTDHPPSCGRVHGVLKELYFQRVGHAGPPYIRPPPGTHLSYREVEERSPPKTMMCGRSCRPLYWVLRCELWDTCVHGTCCFFKQVTSVFVMTIHQRP